MSNTRASEGSDGIGGSIMKRFLAAALLLASVGSVASAQPKPPTGGVATGFICHSGNFCGYPINEQKFDFDDVKFRGVLAVAGQRYVGWFSTSHTVGHWVTEGSATLDPMTLSGRNALGQTVAGNCSGTYGYTAATARAVLDCAANVSGGPIGKVRLVLQLVGPGWLGDGGDGPACVCSDLIGIYFRQA